MDCDSFILKFSNSLLTKTVSPAVEKRFSTYDDVIYRKTLKVLYKHIKWFQYDRNISFILACGCLKQI